LWIQELYNSGEKMKKREKQLLLELIKNSKRSDREIAKVLKVSQPTITRTRKRLEKKAIANYTIVPDFTMLGYELMAFTLISSTGAKPEAVEKAKEWAKKRPNIIFASQGEGMNINGVLISLHKNFREYSKFMLELRKDLSGILKDVQTFLVSFEGSVIIKPLSLTYLGEAK
jgi:DNA-binding Lrp family transcriptional regulator